MVMARLVKAQVQQFKETLQEEQERLRKLESTSEHAMTTWTFLEYALADAPLAADGMSNYAFAVITDGRKDGEGAGNGTGILAMYDPTQDDWLRTSDYSSVVV